MGFASVVYGLIVLESDIDQADRIVHLVTLDGGPLGSAEPPDRR